MVQDIEQLGPELKSGRIGDFCKMEGSPMQKRKRPAFSAVIFGCGYAHATNLLLYADGYVNFDNIRAASVAGGDELFRFAILEENRIRIGKVAKDWGARRIRTAYGGDRLIRCRPVIDR